MRNVFGMMMVLVLGGSTAALAQNWPHWRGPTHDGVSTEKGLPDTWSATCADAKTIGDAGSGPYSSDDV